MNPTKAPTSTGTSRWPTGQRSQTSSIKTAISLQPELLRRIDALAAEMRMARSQVMARAAERLLRDHESFKMLEAIDEAWSEPLTEEEVAFKAAHRLRRAQIQKDPW